VKIKRAILSDYPTHGYLTTTIGGALAPALHCLGVHHSKIWDPKARFELAPPTIALH